ncbi:MAG TPA: D-2-hydroxyacid dehydrogenase [Rhodocyclaceae bacterium]
MNSPKPHIVFLDRSTLAVPLRAPACGHRWSDFDHSAPEQVVARLADADIAVSNKVRIDDRMLTALPRLRHIAIAATGTDHIDLAACKAHGVSVSNIRNYGAESVAEHVFALMLGLSRQLLAYSRDAAAGRWEQGPNFCFLDYPIVDLHGRRLGLVGQGAIGSAVARIAQGFGMELLLSERPGATEIRPGRRPFVEVLATADVLSLHLPLSEATRHLIGAAELDLMKPGALLINTARGALVDEPALAAALRVGRIGGAGIDVLAKEPPPADSPLLQLAREGCQRLLLTPHVAWASGTAQANLAEQLVGNIEAFLSGAPRHLVT